MTFKQGYMACALLVFSGLAAAAAPEGKESAAKQPDAAQTSTAMKKMVDKSCEEHSAARAGDGRELECVKGAWRAVSPEQAKAGQSNLRKARVCRFRCSVSHGIEICRGNGPQCDGVSPW